MELFAETGIWSYLLNALYDVDILPTDEKPSVILQYGRVMDGGKGGRERREGEK